VIFFFNEVTPTQKSNESVRKLREIIDAASIGEVFWIPLGDVGGGRTGVRKDTGNEQEEMETSE